MEETAQATATQGEILRAFSGIKDPDLGLRMVQEEK